ncbi:MAG: DNA-directed RNA polymerase subunit alpha [Clostridia bacterium]|nr:DNA-directed RNA polymerase subunit alpha [Clostridiales bacterium]MBQ7918180.1 DNA-directed RNA polymerase subunit alpha [Clostridia bacterium]
MLEIEKPRIECVEEKGGSYAKFVMEPLEKGFGVTIGNALRRILLSSLPGSAVTNIRIAGVDHEFMALKGAKEDVTEVVLNMKGLAVKIDSDDKNFKKTLKLKAHGPCVVTAADIADDDEVHIMNKNMYICSLEEDGELDMEIMVAQGRGYVPADRNKDMSLPIGYIAIDSIYTPVKRASYVVENTRVGQNTDFDKLTLEVTTNGTVSAKEVVSLSAKLMNEYNCLFIELVENMANSSILVSREEDKVHKLLVMSVEDMDLSVRSYNCLKRAGINTVEDLIKKTEDDMLKVKNLGRKSLDEVIHKLESLGLGLKTNED